jgi:hypothetical protein
MKTIIQIRDTATGKQYTREVHFMSEFYTGSEERRGRQINYWIKERANHQHGSKMELLSYENVQA